MPALGSMLGWLVLAAAGEAVVIPHQKVDGGIDWVYDYAEGQARAKASGLPLFVVFRCER